MIIKSPKKAKNISFPAKLLYKSGMYKVPLKMDFCANYMTHLYPQGIKEGGKRKLFLYVSLSDRGKGSTSIALNKPKK